MNKQEEERRGRRRVKRERVREGLTPSCAGNYFWKLCGVPLGWARAVQARELTATVYKAQKRRKRRNASFSDCAMV